MPEFVEKPVCIGLEFPVFFDQRDAFSAYDRKIRPVRKSVLAQIPTQLIFMGDSDDKTVGAAQAGVKLSRHIIFSQEVL